MNAWNTSKATDVRADDLFLLELILKAMGAIGALLAGIASFFKWMNERANKKIAALEMEIARLRADRK